MQEVEVGVSTRWFQPGGGDAGVKLKWVFQPGDEVRSSLALSRILEADGAQVVIPVPAHPRLFGHGKCMTPKVRSLDGAACVLLCVELKPCRLHVVLLS